MDIADLKGMLEKWQQQKGISRNQALKVLELAVQLAEKNQDLKVELEEQLNQAQAKAKTVEDAVQKAGLSGKRESKLTLRYEYVKNGHSKDKVFGPYLYGYWRENGKLKKKYIGKVEGYDIENDAEN